MDAKFYVSLFVYIVCLHLLDTDATTTITPSDTPCQVLKLDGRDMKFPLDKGLYYLQENKTLDRPTYMKSSEQQPTYIFFSVTEELNISYWVISDSPTKVITGTKVEDNALYPEDITGQWIELQSDRSFKSNPTIELICVENGCESGRLLVGNAEFSSYRSDGIYTRQADDFLERPRYKHNQRDYYIYYNNYSLPDDPIWVINGSPNIDNADGIVFEDVPDPSLAVNHWRFFINGQWTDVPNYDVKCVPRDFGECTIRNRAVYLNTRNSEANTVENLVFNYIAGRYNLLNVTYNFRPVFKHHKRELYLSNVDVPDPLEGSIRHWIIAPQWGISTGWAKVKDAALKPEFILEKRWSHILPYAIFNQIQEQTTGELSISCKDETEDGKRENCITTDCKNGGTCVDIQDTHSATCICPDFYWGEFCQFEVESCGKPPDIENGMLNYGTGTHLLDIINYSCNASFIHRHYDTAVCRPDATWSTLPICEETPVQNDAEEVYVSEKGQNFASCGPREQPCRDIIYAAWRIANTGTMFIVNDLMSCGISKGGMEISQKEISVVGLTKINGNAPLVNCGDLILFVTIFSSNVAMRNLIIKGGVISITGNSTVHLENMTLENTIVEHTGPLLSLFMKNVEWKDVTECTVTHPLLAPYRDDYPLCDPTGSLKVAFTTTSYIDLTIKDSKLHGIALTAGSLISAQIHLDNVLYTHSATKVHDNIQSFIKLQVNTGRFDVKITNSNFTNNRFIDKQGQFSQQAAAVNFMEVLPRTATSEKFQVEIEDCIFAKNTRSIFLQVSAMADVNIVNSIFEDNFSFGEGGAIAVISGTFNRLVEVFNSVLDNDISANLTITSSTFKNNYASNYVQKMYTGRGGALFVDSKYQLTIVSSTFENNSAQLLGGSVYTGQRVKSLFLNGTYGSPAKDLHPFMGDVLYLRGQPYIHGITVLGESVNPNTPLVTFIGSSSSFTEFAYISEMNITCPSNHVLDIRNSSYPSAPIYYEHVFYSCVPCVDDTYSIKGENIWIKTTYKGASYDIDKFTYLPDLKVSITEESIHERINCNSCPYGGYCRGGIQARQNFWGYTENDQVSFEECSPGYGCNDEICESYATCAENRTGALCTSCIAGHSEVLWGTECVPDSSCGNWWVFGALAFYGILYAIILLTEPEWKGFIQAQARWLKKHTIQRITPSQFTQTESEKGYFQIFIYYVQIAALLRLGILYKDKEPLDKTENMLSVKLQEIFDFNAAPLHYYLCIMPGWNVLHKIILNSVYPLYLVLIMASLYPFCKLLSFPKILVHKVRKAIKVKAPSPNVDVRFVLAFLDLLLFTYQSVADVTFSVVDCQEIGNQTMLVVKTDITCYQPWQYVAIAALIIYVVPLFIVMLFGPKAVDDNKLPSSILLLCCIFPVLFVIGYPIKLFIQRNRQKTRQAQTQAKQSGFALAIVDKLQGPFRKMSGVCWEGIIVLRRLLLALCATFAHDVLVKHLLLCVVCFLIFLVQVFVKPFKADSSNMAESISLFTLSILSIIALVKSIIYTVGVLPSGRLSIIMYGIEYVEFTLSTIIPLVVISCILLLVFIRLIFVILGCCPCCKKHTSSSQISPAMSLHSINTKPLNGKPSAVPNYTDSQSEDDDGNDHTNNTSALITKCSSVRSNSNASTTSLVSSSRRASGVPQPNGDANNYQPTEKSGDYSPIKLTDSKPSAKSSNNDSPAQTLNSTPMSTANPTTNSSPESNQSDQNINK